MRDEMWRQQQQMMSELNNLKNEASHVRQEKNSAHINYIQLKQNI